LGLLPIACGEGNESILTGPLHRRGTRDEALIVSHDDDDER
jgi:hypothetical protein